MQKVVAKKAESGYTLAMQIERQATNNQYSDRYFRLYTIKGQYKGGSIFSSWVSDATVVAVDISRKDAAKILRRIRKEKQLSA
jgi:hypothetical protein